MNELISLISIIFLLMFSTCNKTPQIIYNEKNNTQIQSTQSKINITIENCDSVIIMLATLIHPVENLTILENKFIRERMVRVRVPGIDFSGDKGPKNFLLDFSCIIGMSSSKVIELFCPLEVQNDFIKIDKMFQEREEYWLLRVIGAGNFNVKIYDAEVIDVTRDKAVFSDK